jgi:hypothetical protein
MPKCTMVNSHTYYVESRWGGGEETPSRDRLREIIAELNVRDEEHPDTWMVHVDSEWSLRLDEDHFAYLENPDGETVGHLADMSAEQALTLWLGFAAGGPDAVAKFEWKDGPRPVSEQEIAERSERARHMLLTSDRNFYDQLGPELPDTSCKVQGCTRGSIQYSVLCAVHHFEQVRGRPSPFSD